MFHPDKDFSQKMQRRHLKISSQNCADSLPETGDASNISDNTAVVLVSGTPFLETAELKWKSMVI